MDKPKILLVEDDTIDRDLLGNALASTYEVSYTVDGRDALTALEKSKPALILLDLLLSTLDGFAVLQNIRARADSLKDVPVLSISNLNQESDKERTKTLGANGHLVKAEVSIDDIRAKIQELLAATP